MAGWENFFLAEVGASAALAGLLFVGVSLNLSKILATSQLPNRALQALLFLGTILIVSSLTLVPDQPLPLLGIEITAISLALWIYSTILDIRSARKTEPEFRSLIRQNLIFNQVVVLPYLVAGIVLLTQNAGGLYWLVPAMLLSFAKSLLDAWVLLVEINR